MQLYAFDRERRLIAAVQACKEINYYCMECGSIVRLRGGLHRQKHFFHLQQVVSCRQSAKSMPHIHTQKILQEAFAPGLIELEKRFHSIQRIGDAVHEELKIVFEIQCSPISFAEMNARNRDYASLGYQVIWILHDHQFNQWKVSEAEYFLETTHYFTNIDKEGSGEIYDQWAFMRGPVRKRRGEKVYLDITKVCPTVGAGFGREKWRLRVEGDCNPQGVMAKTRSIWGKIARVYWILFGTLLERASR